MAGRRRSPTRGRPTREDFRASGCGARVPHRASINAETGWPVRPLRNLERAGAPSVATKLAGHNDMPMTTSLADKLRSRKSGVCLYGFAPPKQATPADQLKTIVAQQVVRLGSLPADGLIVYDIQDETERVSDERPFPFLPTLNPDTYAHHHLACLAVPK